MTPEEQEKTYLAMERWVDRHPEPDKHIMFIGTESFSPRMILDYWKEQREPIARIVNFVDAQELIESLDRSGT